MGEDHFLNLQPGTIVNGRYEIVKCLGTGSMGMVYACRNRELNGMLVAMKVLFSEVARDEVQAARFRNEIVASYEVNHPNVVRAYEYFKDGDIVAFTMEYVGAGDLADRINESQLEIPEIIKMLTQICGGVQAIHDKGIIHRDLKPENILLTASGDCKITDFGIARSFSGPKLTEHGGVVGTIDYVSPEYLEQGQVDQRSDIYALGVLIYEMLTGESPFKGKSVIETMTMRLRTDPVPPHHLRPDCPTLLSNICLKMMARDPEQRYQSARAILEDLTMLSNPGLALQNAVASTGLAASGVFQNGGALQHFDSTSVQVTPKSAVKPALTPREALEGSTDKRPAVDRSKESLDSVLKNPDGTYSTARKVVDPNGVAVSQSRLSTERLKTLSEDIYYGNDEDSFLKTLAKSFVFVIIGFGTGLFIIRYYYPEYFGINPPAPKGYVE